MLRGLLLFGVYLRQLLWHLLERLTDMDTVFGTYLEKLHAFCLTKLLCLIFGHFSILLVAVDFVAQNAELDVGGCVFLNLC